MGSIATASSPGIPRSVASDAPPTVVLPVQTVASPVRDGLNGTIAMRVGQSQEARVIVDTGFSGLIMFPGAWDRAPRGVRMSGDRVTLRSPSMGRFTGEAGIARMNFSGVISTIAVPFVKVSRESAFLRAWEAEGVVGLLGVGTKGAGMVNPFTTLPGVLGEQWSMHFSRGEGRDTAGAIVLGAPAPIAPSMTFRLPYLGVDVNGARLWDDQDATGCWEIAGRPTRCLSTWFDAAFNETRLRGPIFARLPTSAAGNLRTGTQVALAAPGTAFIGFSYSAGSSASVNLTTVSPRGKTKVIIGNTLYFDNTVTYNTRSGRLFVGSPISKEG